MHNAATLGRDSRPQHHESPLRILLRFLANHDGKVTSALACLVPALIPPTYHDEQILRVQQLGNCEALLAETDHSTPVERCDKCLASTHLDMRVELMRIGCPTNGLDSLAYGATRST